MLFSRRATWLLAAFLIAPEVLRAVSGSLEPYPAVLLPAGAGKIGLNGDRLPLRRTLLEAQRAGRWHAIDATKFLEPLPVHFLGGVLRGEFGFHDGGWRGAKAPPPKTAPADVESTKRWLRRKLEQLGFEAARIRVVEQEVTIEVPSGRRLHEKVLSERVHALE